MWSGKLRSNYGGIYHLWQNENNKTGMEEGYLFKKHNKIKYLS